MPIPGFSLIPPPEDVLAGQAVEMTMERFKPSGCTAGEAVGWLTTQVRDRNLKLSWTDASPEHAQSLYLGGEGFIYFPCFPHAQAIDELDWGAGELRRRIRYPKIADRWGGRDPSKMTWAERLDRDKELREGHEVNALRVLHFSRCAGDTSDEFEEWITEELRYPFRVKRSSLVAILDRTSMPLGTVPVRPSEAAAILAGRFNVSTRIGRDAIIEAAAAGRIEIYGTSHSKLPALPGQAETTGLWVWRQVLQGKATLSDDGSALSAKALNNKPATWSDLYVFRADLERLMRELAGEGNAAEAETGPAEPRTASAECRGKPAGDESGTGHGGESEGPPDTVAPRVTPKEWLARFVADGKHEKRDTTLKTMREAYSQLGVRGGLAVWDKFTKENPQLKLSHRGRKLKRNTNN